MDPVKLATITASLTVLAMDVAKGAASEAGKQLWVKVKSLLGFAADPPQDALAPSLAESLTRLSEEQLRDLLEQLKASGTTSGSLVGNIKAKNVVVAERIHMTGGSLFDQRGGQ